MHFWLHGTYGHHIFVSHSKKMEHAEKNKKMNIKVNGGWDYDIEVSADFL